MRGCDAKAQTSSTLLRPWQVPTTGRADPNSLTTGLLEILVSRHAPRLPLTPCGVLLADLRMPWRDMAGDMRRLINAGHCGPASRLPAATPARRHSVGYPHVALTCRTGSLLRVVVQRMVQQSPNADPGPAPQAGPRQESHPATLFVHLFEAPYSPSGSIPPSGSHPD